MSRYQINKTDVKYAEEFRNNLYLNNYYHSPSLQRILNLFRSGPKKGKYVIVKLNNKKILVFFTALFSQFITFNFKSVFRCISCNAMAMF